MNTLDKLRETDAYKAVYHNYNKPSLGMLIFDIQYSIDRFEKDDQIVSFISERPTIFARMLAELEIFKEILEEVKKNYDK